jgi:predicted phosphoribosyltransferase
MRAALQALQKANPRSILAAVPVASEDALQALRKEADEVVCLQTPQPFHAVGHWYEDFRQVSDEEVIRCLEGARNRTRRPGFLAR